MHAGGCSAASRCANDFEKARKFYRSLCCRTSTRFQRRRLQGEVYLALGQIHLLAREIPKARNMFERGLENDPKKSSYARRWRVLPT